MVTCKINGRQYIVDFTKMEFYSLFSFKGFVFDRDTKVSVLTELLKKNDV